MAPPFNKSHKRALKWLINRGGEGVITSYGKNNHRALLARGDLCSSPLTIWRSLVEYGLVEISNDKLIAGTRIKVLPDGYKEKLANVEEAESKGNHDSEF